MVQEVTSFQTTDGQIHKTRLEALKHEARLALERLDCFNHATIIKLLDEVCQVAPILDAYATEVRRNTAVEDTRNG